MNIFQLCFLIIYYIQSFLLPLHVHPHLCMRVFYVLFPTCIFARPKQIPQEFLNVYFEPFYDDMLELWNGVPTVEKSILPMKNQNFILYAMVYCTIHD